MVQTAALLKPSQKVLDAIKEYTVKIDSETISDLPLKATLIYEALQKYNISPATLADVLGKSPEIVNIYLNQRIDPNLLMDFYGVPYREIDRAKVERQIRAEKQALAITYSGGMSDDWYTNDMAKKLATRGISDLQDFAAHQNDLVLPIGTGVRRIQYDDGNFRYSYLVSEDMEFPIDESKVKVKESIDPEGNIVREYLLTEPVTLDLGVDYFYNKTNGKRFDQSAGNVWESAYEGKGGVYYKVKFTNTGLPVFYTQHFETGWKAEISPFLPFIAIVGAAVGLPLLVGESILGAVGITVESAAISSTIGNVAVNTVLTGGDVGAALAKAAAGAAGGYVGDFAGTGLDSVEMGKIAGAAATAAIQGKDPKNAAALTALTLGVSMGEDYFFDDTDTVVFDEDTISLDDIGVDLDAFDLDAIIAENEFNLESIDLTIDSILPDDTGNIFNGVGEAVELNLENYWDGVGVNAETADVVDPYNRVLIPGNQAVQMTEAEIQAELDRVYRESQGQTVAAGRSYATRKADLPPPAAQVKVPTLLDQTTYADKLLKAAVGIGASVKAIANGTFRPAYTMSSYGTARVQAVGVPITQPDGSVIVNNGNGTQTIRYPNGSTKTVGTNYSSGSMFGGISSTTLLIGGGVLLAALLIARRK